MKYDDKNHINPQHTPYKEDSMYNNYNTTSRLEGVSVSFAVSPDGTALALLDRLRKPPNRRVAREHLVIIPDFDVKTRTLVRTRSDSDGIDVESIPAQGSSRAGGTGGSQGVGQDNSAYGVGAGEGRMEGKEGGGGGARGVAGKTSGTVMGYKDAWVVNQVEGDVEGRGWGGDEEEVRCLAFFWSPDSKKLL